MFIKSIGLFVNEISFKYFTQLLSAVHTCHKMNVVHRDLKLQNILILDTFQLKVTDFGLASIVDNKTSDKIIDFLTIDHLIFKTMIFKGESILNGYIIASKSLEKQYQSKYHF